MGVVCLELLSFRPSCRPKQARLPALQPRARDLLPRSLLLAKTSTKCKASASCSKHLHPPTVCGV